MKVINENQKISIIELKKMAGQMFGGLLVKAVVDIEEKSMAVDAELHADEEQFLLENNSKQKNLWGINLYPASYGSDDFIEFDSMINLRPSQGNRSRNVDDPKKQQIIIKIVNQLVEK